MTDLKRTDRRRMRAMNTQLVVDCIVRSETTSQADLIRATKLNTGTIVSIVRDLRHRGLVLRVGQGASRGGRRPTLLRLNPSAATVLSCQVGADRATAAVLDLGAGILARRELPIERELGPGVFIAGLVDCLRSLILEHGCTGGAVAGLGLSLHGPVDAARGVLLFSEHLGWRDVSFRDCLQRALGMPVFAEAEARAMALAEQRWGAARGARDFVLIELDTGIGMVQVLDGKLCRGQHDLAGELGFTVWDTTEQRSGKQRPHILEELASLRALCQRARELPEFASLSSEPSVIESREEWWLGQLLSASQNGSAGARHILDDATRALGMAIANVVNLLDPELVLLTGKLVSAGHSALVRPIRACAEGYLLATQDRAPRIECTTLGEDVALLGAARLVIDHFLSAENLVAEKIHSQA